VKALSDVSFNVDPGSITGLLGRNGAGKTTIIRILTTLLTPSNGKATVGGFDVTREPQRVREIIGYAGQDTERSLYYRLSPLENAIYFGWLRGLSSRTSTARLEDLVGRIGMEDRLHRQFITLSGGEKQVFVVLRALLHHPAIAFLDEPSKSLDVLTARSIRKLLKDFVAEYNTTMLITYHNLKELENLCDDLILIDRGQIVFMGEPEKLKATVLQRETVEITGNLPEKALARMAELGEIMVSDKDNKIKVVTSNPYKTIR